MLKHADFLVEIQTEELPPKALHALGENFCRDIQKRLTQAELTFAAAEFFATPRRLAVRVNNLLAKQTDNIVERRGPAWQAAFNAAGEPTPACVGFARTCGTTPDKLMTIENKQGKWVGFRQAIPGKTVQELMPDMVQQILAALPIPKRMRWGAGNAEFVRPVHSVILMYGAKVIKAVILGCKTGQKTKGHRFYSKKELKITKPNQYAAVLEKKGRVIADFSKRKEKILVEAQTIVQRSFGNKAKALITDDLLDEVTGLVEWPVAILGKFDAAFLNVPQEALISAMQDHQRYFPVADMQNKLLPHFVCINNIKSENVKQVIAGNERVLKARLSDAAFFFETDKKIKLMDRAVKLSHVTFQAKLGSLADKTERLKKLTIHIATLLGLDSKQAQRAASLAKADLTTELVGEFPELQGIAGYYYALHDGEGEAVAQALKEQYQPRFSGDQLPASLLGCSLALADRLDTLVGIFGIDLLPTGDKDPYGLRRAAMGVLRILIEKNINLDVSELIQYAHSLYHIALPNQNAVSDVWNFMLDRLKPWYQEQGVTADVFAAVAALNLTKPYDIHCRIQAVRVFKKLPQAEALSVANKRVSNLLLQYGRDILKKEIDANLFEHDAERELLNKLNQCANELTALIQKEKYQEVLAQLAKLREPVDYFFDHVLVMSEDEKRRENRLLILKKLRGLFLQVADIALLQ